MATQLVARLHAVAERHRQDVRRRPRRSGCSIQTLVAAWPIDADRAWAYIRKASREGKEDTNWLEPDEAYEADLERFVRDMIVDSEVVRS